MVVAAAVVALLAVDGALRLDAAWDVDVTDVDVTETDEVVGDDDVPVARVPDVLAAVGAAVVEDEQAARIAAPAAPSVSAAALSITSRRLKRSPLARWRAALSRPSVSARIRRCSSLWAIPTMA